LISGGEERPADRVRRHRPVLHVHAFDQEIRQASTPSQEPELLPKAPGDQVEVQTTDRLPLDDRAAADGVVADAEPSRLDVHTEVEEERRHAAVGFAYICHDPHAASRVAPDRSTASNETADLRPLLALSRSESA
jgi:hypothetical protein